MYCVLHRNNWKQTTDLGLYLLSKIKVEIFKNLNCFIVESSGDGRHVYKGLSDINSIFIDTLDDSGLNQWLVGDDYENIVGKRIATELDNEVNSLNKLVSDRFKFFGLKERILADDMVVDLKIGIIIEVEKRHESSSSGSKGQINNVVWFLIAIEFEECALYFNNDYDLAVKYKFIIFMFDS